MTRFTWLLAAAVCFGQGVESFTYLNPNRETAALAAREAMRLVTEGMAPASERRLGPVERPAADPAAAGAYRSGVHRAIGRGLDAEGRWEAAGDGRRVWRAAIRSSGAEAIRVHFRRFQAGDGAVWLRSGGSTFGPYTGAGVWGDGDFWSEAAFGESVTIEFVPAAGAGDAVPFEVAEISHLWDNPAEPKAGAERGAAPCHLDVTCSPDWLETARSVARITMEKDGGSFFCSGSLLSTSDRSGVPYFLTAQHCLDDDTTARTVVAYWSYQTATCNGTVPALRGLATSVGARFVSGDAFETADFTLLRLNSVPSGVLFAGWNPEDPPQGGAVVGIHHPAGEFKRISFGNRDTDSRIANVPIQNFYTIRWARGRTEGGSSGSPLFNDRRQVVGTLSHGPKAPRGGTVCDAENIDFYGRFSVQFRTVRRFLEGGGQTPANPATPTQLGGTLISGQARTFNIAAAQGALLYTGQNLYRIDVPAGASRLDVSVSTATPGVDINLYVRYNADPAVNAGAVQADHRSENTGGEEAVAVTSGGSPALRQGQYVIALSMLTTNRAASGTITATITTGGGNQRGILLSSGAPRSFRFGAVRSPLLNNGDFSYRIDVPNGATRLEVRLATATPGVDVDLHVRYSQDVTISGSSILSDYKSDGDAGDEQISISSSSSPPLRPGTYFISLIVWTPDREVSGNVTATVTGATPTAPPAPRVLISGTPATFALPAVDRPTLYNGNYSFRVDVGPNSGRLEIRLRSTKPEVDVDVYVRKDADVALGADGIVAEWASTRDTGNEDLVITQKSEPPLTPGTHWVSLVLWTTGSPATGTVTAVVVPAIGTELSPGEPVSFSLPAVDRPTLLSNTGVYRFTVPEGAAAVAVAIATSTPGVDIDLVIRAGQPAAVLDGDLAFDYGSFGDTGEEAIVIDANSSPPPTPGVYYASLVQWTTGKPAQGAIVFDVVRAEVTRAPAGPSWTRGKVPVRAHLVN